MLFQWLCIFFGSPPWEADFWNHWNSQFHDAQNPSQKHGFIFDHKFHEIWCAQNASQRSLFRIFIVLALDFCKIKESALPRITPLTFFSCCRAGASTHSWEVYKSSSQAGIIFSSIKSLRARAHFGAHRRFWWEYLLYLKNIRGIRRLLTCRSRWSPYN